MPKAEGPAKVKLRSPGPVSPLRLATGPGAQWQDRRRPEHHSASASTPRQPPARMRRTAVLTSSRTIEASGVYSGDVLACTRP